jgi:hypothetical protein
MGALLPDISAGQLRRAASPLFWSPSDAAGDADTDADADAERRSIPCGEIGDVRLSLIARSGTCDAERIAMR